MRQIELTQGTNEWLTWRKNGIGSSEASTLMGVNPWQTIDQLWLDKLGESEEIKDNWAMKRGRMLEPMVRQKYIKETGTIVLPLTAEHNDFDFIRASFDGINLETCSLIEIKCPGHKDHSEAVKGEIPAKYYPQLQWQLLVSGYDHSHYVSYREEDFRVVTVKKDTQYQRELIQKAQWFWELVKTKTPPSDPLSSNIEDLFKEYSSLKAQSFLIEQELEHIKNQIKENTKDDPISANGYKAQWIERKGLIDYTAIPELQSIDVEKYRKPTTKVFDLRAIKGIK